MDEKREKNGDTIIILRPGPLHRKKVGGALAAINKIAEEHHDLLVWIKAREMMWEARASKERARVLQQGGASLGDSAATLQVLDATSRVGIYSGRAEAYHDVWRQILFPGISVEDGTLSGETFNKAEKEWRQKAEEELKKAACSA